MKEQFIEKVFRQDSLDIIAQANAIIEEMQAQGYTLTVRQLYYQFVARDLIENKQSNYKRLASIIDNGRKAGLIDWDAIEDRTRNLQRIAAFADPAAFITAMVRHYYAEELWADQDVYCEVWIEKDALMGVIERVCDRWRVPYFACRGYASSSELYAAANRLRHRSMECGHAIVFHLGDHDPSGLDMTRCNQDSLDLFSFGHGIEVRRLALNWDQIEEHRPPPNPAKETDSRFEGYRSRFGDESWELDALNPRLIEDVIETAILDVIDRDAFDEAKAREEANEERLREIAERWDEIEEILGE